MLKVAIVAPSLDILGGQSVQADRLLKAWAGDADVRAWLVPVNPKPPRGLGFSRNVKYLRTCVTEAVYGPQLLRELRYADVVHVFSASYFSFLLAPLPAIAAAKWLGRPVILNYHSGEAPDHLKRSALARATLARVDRVSAALRPIVGLDQVMQLQTSLARIFAAQMSRLVRYGFINGLPGFVTIEQSDVLQTTALQVEDGRIVAIYVMRNPDKLRHLRGHALH